MKFLFIAFLACFTFSAWADSPITSTNFSTAYSDEPIVQKAAQTSGLLTDELMAYLVNDTKPVDVKMAVINQLGWDYNGKNNTATFISYLKNTKRYKNDKVLRSKASADVLLCLAYLRAMDNYFEVKEAVMYADLALKKNKTSYTFQIIAGIIKAQDAFDTDWCKLFQQTDAVRNKTSDLKMDMRTAAIDSIFEYMDLYRDDCN